MKGRPWCQDLKTADVEIGFDPKLVTLVLPYYENSDFLSRTQVEQWHAWPKDVRDHVEVIVVDDGSPMPLRGVEVEGVRIRVFQIDVDVRWNWLAARNIGAHHAAGEWLLLTDMDHVVPADTMRAAIYGDLNPNIVYVFRRQEHTGEHVSPHSASFLMTKHLFWTIGGYDEALSGLYGTDGDWRRRVEKHARMEVLSFPLIRHEYVGDSSTVRYKRKQPQDAAVSRIVRARGKGWKPKTLSFPYHELTVQEAPCAH